MRPTNQRRRDLLCEADTLLELTTPDVEKYLAEGGDLALLPIGPTEMHGPHLPLGTDLFDACAVALRVAEAANGIILPSTWPTTGRARPTVSRARSPSSRS